MYVINFVPGLDLKELKFYKMTRDKSQYILGLLNVEINSVPKAIS